MILMENKPFALGVFLWITSVVWRVLPIAGRFVREDGCRGDHDALARWSPRLNIVLTLITKVLRSRGTGRGLK